ncbi:MAG TPA: hypothetical protein VFX12_11495 [Vicinamibacterales bacterium]|nr:hypothetical protein [Vicinamibacterales bacterium]
MDVSRALEQIAEIHQQIAKAEVYRGYRPVPVAASGLIGLTAAALQPHGLAAGDPLAFTVYWMTIAACAGLVGGIEILHHYVVDDDPAARRRTRQVVGQLLPSLAAGALIGAAAARLDGRLVPLLPGVWALCFGVGIFASRPYLPRAAGWVAMFYAAAGAALLWLAPPAGAGTGWWIGGTFGVGQLFAAAVLWRDLERI